MLAVELCLGACSQSPRSVDYYATNPQVRTERVKQCLIDMDQSQDCDHAKQAEFDAKGVPARNGRAL